MTSEQWKDLHNSRPGAHGECDKCHCGPRPLWTLPGTEDEGKIRCCRLCISAAGERARDREARGIRA